MKTKAIRTACCFHCHQDYIMAKSTQKFCKTSCRSASHRMNKRKNSPKSTKISEQNNLEGLSAPSKSSSFASFLADTAAASIPTIINELVKSSKEVNNGDLKKILNDILINQIIFQQEVTFRLNRMEQELRKDKSNTIPLILGN